MDVLAANVAAGGSVEDAAELVGIRPSTVEPPRKPASADRSDRRAAGHAALAAGWLLAPSLEPD